MNATVSPVRLMSPAAMRFGVWHALTAGPAGAGAPKASTADEASAWQVEWRLPRSVPVPLAVLSRWWWMASLLGLTIALAPLTGMRGAFLDTPVVPQIALEAVPSWFVTLGVVMGTSLIALWALRTCARHAQDHDHIAMRADRVHVASCRGGRTHTLDCHPRWVRVEPLQHDRSLIRVSGEGRSVVVGEFVPGEGRRQLANELRWALRHLDD